MAAMGDNNYLPSLDRCLNGDVQLLSWETVYKGLSRLPTGYGEQALKSFFEDQRTIDLLTKVLSPSSAPTANTRAYFDTQTSAIHITPDPSGRYDINEIKEDSLWLSKEVAIEEIAALRICILEYQARPATWLLQGFPDWDGLGMEVLAKNKSADSFLRSSNHNAGASLARPSEDASNTVRTRRLRLLEVYLSERQYLSICADFVTFRAIYPGPFQDSRDADSWGIPLSPNESSWLRNAGVEITTKWKLSQVASERGKHWVIDAIAALELRIRNIGDTSGWLQEEDTAIDVEPAWCQIQLTDILHILYMILNLTLSESTLTRSDVFQTWFRFMADHGFFEQFELPFTQLHALYSFPIQCLFSIVSLAMLKLPLALVTVQDMSTSAPADDSAGNAPYLLNKAVIESANDILLTAAGALSFNASLAVFGWGILMQTIRGHAEESKESRELRLSQHAVDSFDASQRSDIDSNEDSSGQRRPSPHRRSSTGSDTSQQITYFEGVLEIINKPSVDEDPITFLARVSVDQLHVFDMISSLSVNFCTTFGSENFGAPGLKIRLLLLELIRASLEWLDYQPDVVQATLATLQGSDNYWNNLACTPAFNDGAPTSVFQEDQFLMQQIFEVARSRYPYESLPFLKICRTLASCRSSPDRLVGSEPLQARLSRMETFTCLLPEESVSYRLHGDADSIYLELISQLSMFEEQPTKRLKYTHSSRNIQTNTSWSTSSSFVLDEGTTGRTLTEGRPHVVLWRHEYSALRYIGRILQRAVQDDALRDFQGAESKGDIVIEIVGLITVMLASVSYGQIHDWRQDYAEEMAGSLLDETSDLIGSQADIVSLVFSIFEAELYRIRSASNGTESIQLLLHCIQFTHALLALLPGHVWTFLSRSGLLGLDGSDSRLAAVVAKCEITSGNYEFLIGCIRLYEALVEDALNNIVSRKEHQNAPTRYTSTEQDRLGTGITEVTMKRIIHGFERLMIDVLDSCRNWRFEFPEQRMEINTRICSLFDKTLTFCFSIDDNLDISQKLTSCLAPSADYLLNVFLSKNANDQPFKPLLNILLEALSNSNNIMVANRFYREQALQTEAAVRFITTLIRVNRYLDTPSSMIEGQILKATPVLARLYAADTGIKLPIIELLEALLKPAGSSSEQKYSLLGQLGRGAAKCFLDMLSVLDQPLDNTKLSMYIWRLMSVIVGHGQQWLAIYLLTGSTPRDSLKYREQARASSIRHVRPMLRIAIERFADLNSILPEEAISILDFLTQAADFWPLVVDEILQDSNLIEVFTKFLSSLRPLLASGDQNAHEEYPNKLQMASQILSICAMGVHRSIETGEPTFANKLRTSLGYLVDYGVAVPAYNVSLHSNLRRNFESKFASCKLMNFKRTTLSQSPIGKDFYYDIAMAGKVLAYDVAWAGRGDGGFQEEFERANVNLSIVEGQVNLLHSWKTLVTQLSTSLNDDPQFRETLADIIRDCLQSNQDSNLPQAVFERLCQSRADLAFVLMQRIVETSPKSAEAWSILKPTWTALRSIIVDLGFESTVGEATYSRTLLKILYLALQAHVLNPETASFSESSRVAESQSTLENTQMVLEILSVVVAKGFRSLTTLLHEDPTKVSPSDYVLLNAILRSGLRVTGIERQPEQLITQFNDNYTARYACTLLSWSDQLTIGDDPVYGELSMIFLLELSAIPVLAEALAVGGVLSGISTATLMQYFCRPGGIGPFNEPTRMYGIWFRNLLPLALNLLGAVGAPIAAEVSVFINQFRGQLSRSSNSFDTKPPSPSDPMAGYITLGMAFEAHSLALIRDILEKFREAGPSAGIVAAKVVELSWDRSQVKEDIENWLQRRRTLRECILATNEKEEIWSRQRPLSAVDGAENRLEEKVVAEMSAALSILGDAES